MAKQLVNSVAKTIRQIRKARNFSQEELADKAGLDRTYISGIERGIRNISLESLELVIFSLEMTVENFLDELKQNL